MKKNLLIVAGVLMLVFVASIAARVVFATPTGEARITSPLAGTQISGKVEIKCVATITTPEFAFYKIEFGLGENPPGFGAVSGIKDKLPSGEVCDTWDTTQFPDGPVTLKLTVVDKTANYLQGAVKVVINNHGVNYQHIADSNCAECHKEEHKRWATTLHAADASAVLLNPEHNTEELLTDECIGCHAPFEASKFQIGDFVQPVDQKGPWQLVAKNETEWHAIQCAVCHDVTSKAPNKLAFYDPTKQAYVAVQTSTELCEKCHQPGTDDSRDLKGSVHEGLQCATCHFQKGTEMSLDPHQSCAQCHPKVNPKHPDVTQLDTTYASKESKNDIHFVTCAVCHPQGVPTQ